MDLLSCTAKKNGFDALIFNIIDWGSKFLFSFLIPDKTGLSILNCLKQLGTINHPKIIKCDNGSEFNNSLVKDWCQ